MTYLRRHLRVLRLLSVLVAVAIVAGLVGSFLHRNHDSSQNAQYLALIEGCQRLNILRAEDNVSHFADYKVFRIVLIESRALPERPGETAQEKRFSRLFLKQLASAVRAKSWTPITDCKKAVNRRGVKYTPPEPIPFYKQLPSSDALHYSLR